MSLSFTIFTELQESGGGLLYFVQSTTSNNYLVSKVSCFHSLTLLRNYTCKKVLSTIETKQFKFFKYFQMTE